MARATDRLTAVQVRNKRKAGRYADGGGLYLQVGPTGGKAWLFRYKIDKREHFMGLGSCDVVDLKEARAKARECRRLLLEGIDPIATRDAARATRRQHDSKTFAECAGAYIKSHRTGWRNDKHASQWGNTLATYCGPVFGAMPVQNIDTARIMRVLEPLWTKKNETARRVRGRVEKILDWATVHGYRTGENPARWRGHLDKLLPPPSKVAPVEHHPALPHAEIAAFMKELRAHEAVSARALEFAILTAARTNEVIGAKWTEIELEGADGPVWTIPAERMKARREHRVPLSAPALRLLERLPREGEYVFPGGVQGRPLSNMAMAELLKGMRPDITVHGFRSTFRDWAGEATNFPREVAEAALAHTLKDKTEAAYRRGDAFNKRRVMMDAWADYCARERATVVRLERVA